MRIRPQDKGNVQITPEGQVRTAGEDTPMSGEKERLQFQREFWRRYGNRVFLDPRSWDKPRRFTGQESIIIGDPGYAAYVTVTHSERGVVVESRRPYPPGVNRRVQRRLEEDNIEWLVDGE
jgi:hypothetical protein